MKEVIVIDEGNKNYLWKDKVKIEVTALTDMDFFKLKPKKYKPSDDYQLKNLIFFHLEAGSLFQGKSDCKGKSDRCVRLRNILDYHKRNQCETASSHHTQCKVGYSMWLYQK